MTEAEGLEIAGSRARRRGVEARPRGGSGRGDRAFAEHGYSDAVTQALAERLGVGKGTLYRCFPSKQDLFLAAVDRVIRQLRDISIKLVGSRSRSTRSRWGFAGSWVLRGSRNMPNCWCRAGALQRPADADIPRASERERDAARRTLYSGLIADGRMRTFSVERVADMVGDLLCGTIFTNVFADRRRPSRAAKPKISWTSYSRES